MKILASDGAGPGRAELQVSRGLIRSPNTPNAAAGRGGLPREFLELYHSVEALRADGRTAIVHFIAPGGSDGTTTVASGFARAAGASSAALPVLYIDGRPLPACAAGQDADHPSRVAPSRVAPSLIATFIAGRPLSTAVSPASGAPGVLWAWLGFTDEAGPWCGPEDMARLFGHLREQFSLVVLDSPAISAASESVSLARHCDGTVLVVRAERTGTRAVAAACNAIERLGGQVVGTVFNRRRSWPRWLQRLL